MEVLRKKLEPNSGVTDGVTYDPETDDVLYNGEPNDNFDPRTNPAYQLPTGSNQDCGAVEGMRVEIAKWVLGVVGATSVVGLTNLLLTAALFLIPVGWMFGAFWAVANAAITLGSVAIGNAFTPDVLEQIRCILLACVLPDGSITEAGLQKARAGVDQEIGDPIVTACFDLMIQSWGAVGFTNAGVLNYDPEIVCDCCPPDVFICNNTANFSGGVEWNVQLGGMFGGINYGNRGVYDPTVGRNALGSVKSTVPAGSSDAWIFCIFDIGAECVVQTSEFYWRASQALAGSQVTVGITYYDGDMNVITDTTNNVGATGGWQQRTKAGIGGVRYVAFRVSRATNSVQFWIDDICITTL